MTAQFYQGLGKTKTWPDLPGISPASLTYDDVLLVPQLAESVTSRSEVDVSVKFGPFELTKPIVTAPMDTIVSERMMRLVAEAGGLGFFPRGPIKQVAAICKKLTTDGVIGVYAVGLKHALEDAKLLKKAGAQMILVDVAHGGMAQVIEVAKDIRKKLNLFVIAGNIVSFKQAQAYRRAGIDLARVGVGPGGLCSTRLVAGAGFPQLSAILETTSTGIDVIADGGIRKPADAAKALAAGAKVIMIGSLLGGTEETPGEVTAGKKKVRGQASEDFMQDQGLATGEFRAAEGIDTSVPARGSAIHVINELAAGIRSAMSYTDAGNLSEFRKKAQFVLVSESTRFENTPHILNGH